MEISNDSRYGFVLVYDLTDFEEVTFKYSSFLLVILNLFFTLIMIFSFLFSKDVRESCDIFTFVTNCSYFLICFFLFYIKIVEMKNFFVEYSTFICITAAFSLNILLFLAQMNFFASFLNRYLILRFPFKYSTYCSSKTVNFVSIFIFLFCILLNSTLFIKLDKRSSLCNGLINFNSFYVALISIFGFLIIIPSLIIYFLIFKLVKNHVNNMRNQVNFSPTISKSIKLNFINMIISFVLWMIYGIIFIKSSSLNGNFSRKFGYTLQTTELINILIQTVINLLNNPSIKKLFRNKFYLPRFHQ